MEPIEVDDQQGKLLDEEAINILLSLAVRKKNANYLPEILSIFAKQASSILEQLQHCQDSMAQISDCHNLLHQLKGSAQTVGARGLAKRCGKYQKQAAIGELRLGEALPEISNLLQASLVAIASYARPHD